MVKFIKDTSVLPIAKVGRVGIRAWENKDTTITYQFRITSSRVKSKTEAWRNTEKLTGRKLRTKLEDFSRALQDKVVAEEEVLERGLVNNIPSDITLKAYINHFLEIKDSRDIKHTTINNYKGIAVRCNERFGSIKVTDITVTMLNQFYTDLSKTQKLNGKKARCKTDLRELMKPFYITQVELYKLAGLSDKTVESCVNGKNIEWNNAHKIYNAFVTLLNDKDKIEKTNGIRSRKRKSEPPITKMPKYKFSDIFETIDSGETLSAKTVWEHHQFLYSVLSLAIREGIIKYNPAESAEKPKYKKIEQKAFKIEEIQRILEKLNDEYQSGRVSAKWRAIMYLLIYTGARRGEIAGLRWEAIDFESREIVINNTVLYVHGEGTYSSDPKTETSNRKLVITDDLLKVIDDYKLDCENKGLKLNGYVFTQANGKPINPCSITDWCDNFSAKHNLPHIHPHAFRHSVATNLIHQNIDVVTVSHMLGHSKPSVTMDIYAHAFRDNNSTACEKIADIYSNK